MKGRVRSPGHAAINHSGRRVRHKEFPKHGCPPRSQSEVSEKKVKLLANISVRPRTNVSREDRAACEWQFGTMMGM